MAENRLNRNQETREKTERVTTWKEPSLLPDPDPEEGYTFHWVRVSTNGQLDPSNVSYKLREGWVPVKATDHPEIQQFHTENDRFKDNIVMGGLMLCKAPVEMTEDRKRQMQAKTESQMYAVDNNLMRENDPRMPLFNERKSKVTFGTGK